MMNTVLISSLSLLSLLLTFISINLVSSVPCNWFLNDGFAEGFCSGINTPLFQRSSIFECNGNNGTFSIYPTNDCSGTPLAVFDADPNNFNFVCNSNDNSCGVTKLIDEIYINTTDCSGEQSNEFFWETFYINKIDCFESTVFNQFNLPGRIALKQFATPGVGLLIENYNDTECNDLVSTAGFDEGDCVIRSSQPGSVFSSRRTLVVEVAPPDDSDSDSDSDSSSSSSSSD